MPLLFISYKCDDKVAVTKIADRLKKEFYFQVWIDTESIPGGEDWQAEIRKGIDRADVVLLMLTPDACASADQGRGRLRQKREPQNPAAANQEGRQRRPEQAGRGASQLHRLREQPR